MNTTRVPYYDGKVSTRQEAELTLEGEILTLRCDGGEHTYPLASLALPPGIGSVRRTLRLPNGGICELEEGELLHELEGRIGRPASTAVHRWEKSLPLSLGALLLTALIVFLFMRYGVPVMARRVAFAIPPATETGMGRESLATLDRLLMKPTTLPKERQTQLTDLFRRVAGPTGIAAGYRLEFRSCPAIGANAFALPSGIVVMTDGLVELARDDDELAAILAHELGHVRSRHIMRHVLQSSTAGLVMATLTGDLVSITSLAATLPTAVVDASFSREFEREADDAAILWMKSACVHPRRYAEILGRLQAQLDVRSGQAFDKKHPARNYLSSHPDTGDRIRRVMQAGG